MKAVETKYYANGNKESEIEYLDSKKHGRYQDWCDNGNRWEDSNWKNGNRHGRFQAWHDNGQQFEDSNWKNGKLHGRCQMWWIDQRAAEESYYINGDICSKAEWDEHSKEIPLLDIYIPGKPIANDTRKGKWGHYKTKEYKAYKSLIGVYVQNYCKKNNIKPINSAVVMHLHIFLAPPKSWSKKRRDEVLGNPVPVKPDSSNLLKTIEDAISKEKESHFYIIENDSRITDHHIYKRYANEAGIKIILEKLKGE